MFDLEMGLNADDGTLAQGGLVFGRQAFVGLSDSWGELTLGRQYGSLYRLGANFNAFGIASSGPSANVIGGFAGRYEPVRGASTTRSDMRARRGTIYKAPQSWGWAKGGDGRQSDHRPEHQVHVCAL